MPKLPDHQDPAPASPRRGRKPAMLLGLGLDGRDGHVRITKGDNFVLRGGSEETHERMTETTLRFNEKLAHRGKRLDEVEHQEFIDLMHEAAEGTK
ncbi:MAG: hypothetical protein WC708_14465 [Lentisphaeria bacterium]